MQFRRAVILCGGQSKRMGVDKSALQDAHGRYLLEGMVDTLAQRFNEVALVRRGHEALPFSHPKAIVLHDIDDVGGPLCGICSGLVGTEGYVFVTACDMPNINFAFIDAMASALRFDPRADICAGMAEGFVQPFHAFYHTRLIERMLPLLGNTSPTRFIRSQPHTLLPESAVRACSPDLSLYTNLNRPADLQRMHTVHSN